MVKLILTKNEPDASIWEEFFIKEIYYNSCTEWFINTPDIQGSYLSCFEAKALGVEQIVIDKINVLISEDKGQRISKKDFVRLRSLTGFDFNFSWI